MARPIARLSSLDLIRGFVAVGRRMSITQAAEDLCVTQSAVSRQIRTLEDMLGIKLLKRGHRSVTFTSEGERLFRAANSAVQNLQDAVEALYAERTRPPVTITCTIGIAGLWLLPRLSNFQVENPDIEVRIAANDRVEDLRGEGIDLALRYCTREAVTGDAEWLFGEVILPVAHPALGLHVLEGGDALRNHFLLEFDGPRYPGLKWEDWLISQGWEKARPKGTLRFNQYDQVISAATAGQGIALGRLNLLGPMLSEGRLHSLRVPAPAPSTSYGYWLIKAKAKSRPDVLVTANWIVDQARRAQACLS